MMTVINAASLACLQNWL